jgi:hypothetical protein
MKFIIISDCMGHSAVENNFHRHSLHQFACFEKASYCQKDIDYIWTDYFLNGWWASQSIVLIKVLFTIWYIKYLCY